MQDKNPIQTSYDQVAEEYSATFWDELAHKPFDSALLDRFAAVVGRDYPGGSVWEVGCGPGQVARYLQDHGLSMSGLDLSERMVASARRLSPDITFARGDMLSLPVSTGALAGIVAFYAVIHLTRMQAQAALTEFYRALGPGGHLLLAFHGGEGEIHTEEWFGRPVDVTATLFEAGEMADYGQSAGLATVEIHEREPYEFEYPSRRVYVWMRKPLAETPAGV